jgi:hypothetical protein
MNRTLTIVLLTGTLTLQVAAKRNSEGAKAGTPASSGISSGVTTETSPAPTRTAPGYSVRTPSTPTPASPFVAPVTPATPATPRTYTPSTPVYRGESYKGRSEKSTPEAVQQKPTTRVETPAASPFTTPQRERKTTVTPEPVRVETARDVEQPRSRTIRERKETTPEPVITATERNTEQSRSSTLRERKVTTPEPVLTTTERNTEQPRSRVQRERTPTTSENVTIPFPAQPEVITRGRTTRERQPSDLQPVTQAEPRRERTSQSPTGFSSRERTAQPDDAQRVRITPPTRTPSRTGTKEPSPFIFNESTPQPTTPAQKAIYSRHERPNYELTAQRAPAPVHTVQHHPETRNYYSHHYPSHHHSYRPVTCYSGHDAFWAAFGFTLAAPFVAPLYVASGFAPYPTHAVTTTWGNDHFAFSVSTRSSYPVYTYRPYYCTSAWGYHDGWQHSQVYYGGWRSSWYGGFSYAFNPYPVYRTYYLYEEPQTVVIQQPAPQVIIYNQPAQPVVQNQDFVAAPAVATPATAAPVEQPAVAEEPERCLCACKCNGKVPCICEYECGSEFAYSPQDYTLGGFVSYSESLNTELIWSSYAGLDRPEAIDVVAEATE